MLPLGSLEESEPVKGHFCISTLVMLLLIQCTVEIEITAST